MRLDAFAGDGYRRVLAPVEISGSQSEPESTYSSCYTRPAMHSRMTPSGLALSGLHLKRTQRQLVGRMRFKADERLSAKIRHSGHTDPLVSRPQKVRAAFKTL
jgi:hypothetical protein